MANNYEYFISEDGKRGLLRHVYSDTDFYMSNEPRLPEILKTPGVYFNVHDADFGDRKKPYVIILASEGAPITPPFHRVAYDVYYKGLNADNIADRYRERNQNYNAPDAPTIDHLDGNWRNNTAENLFEMARSDNREKYFRQKKIKGCFHVALANDGRFCRIQFTYCSGLGKLYAMRFRCINGAEINDCLTWLWDNRWLIKWRRDGKRLEDTAGYNVVNRHFLSMKWPHMIEAENMFDITDRMLARPADSFPLFNTWEAMA